GGVVTLIAPSDLMDQAAASVPVRAADLTRASLLRPIPTQHIIEVARRLEADGPAVLLLGSEALTERGQRAAFEVATSTGARLMMESYPAIVSLGGDLPALERLAYFPNDVLRQLGSSCVILAGARAPVSYFGYEGHPSSLVDEDRLLELSSPGLGSVVALERLAEQLRGRGSRARAQPGVAKQPEDSPTLSPIAVAEELVRQLPEEAIVSLEGATVGGPFLQRAHRARRHRVMTNTGGAIGQ